MLSDYGEAKGNFSLDIFEETEYLIKAKLITPLKDDKSKTTHSSQCVIVTAKDSAKPIEIMLEKGDSNCDEDEFRKSR